jgi:selenide,water dikinase
MPQGQLAQVLRGIDSSADGRLLVGPQTMDDAGVVLLGRAEGLPEGVELALVQTLDFFPPVVDDPYLYGAIAAANSLSDVYAMGGRPVSVLTLASFPVDFPHDWLAEILRGGFDKVREAGALVAGGHTVEGEAQFGFSVTGVVERERMTANSGARAGDRVYLTKSIGMGALTTSAKIGKITWKALEPAAHQMAMLNAPAAEAMLAAGAHACTDITGYGLVGHGRNVARASGVCLRVRAADVPVFPGALELSRKGLLSGGSKRGRASLGSEVRIGPGIEEALVDLFFDAETSGGLLIAIHPERAAALERELASRGVPVHAIGEFTAAGSGDVSVELV